MPSLVPYKLRIEVDSGLVRLLKWGGYEPVAELLGDNTWTLIPEDKFNEWVELGSTAEKVKLTPPDSDSKPVLTTVDGKSYYDIQFEAARVGSKAVFCFFQPLLDEEDFGM
jgi:hypothetical protein